MAGRPETKQYWIDQLSEYWDSGLTIQEYCELKEVSYETFTRSARINVTGGNEKELNV